MSKVNKSSSFFIGSWSCFIGNLSQGYLFRLWPCNLLPLIITTVFAFHFASYPTSQNRWNCLHCGGVVMASSGLFLFTWMISLAAFLFFHISHYNDPFPRHKLCRFNYMHESKNMICFLFLLCGDEYIDGKINVHLEGLTMFHHITLQSKIHWHGFKSDWKYHIYSLLKRIHALYDLILRTEKSTKNSIDS